MLDKKNKKKTVLVGHVFSAVRPNNECELIQWTFFWSKRHSYQDVSVPDHYEDMVDHCLL